MSEGTDSDLTNMSRDELIAEVKRLRRMVIIEPEKPIEYIKIVVLSILAACIYGIAHDLVTAHVCIEYFMPPFHPVIVPTDSPIALALIWGVIATWWVGLFLGILLAFVCRLGRRPKLTVKDVIRPIIVLLTCIYAASMLSGTIGYAAARMGWITLPDGFVLEQHIHASLVFNFVAHNSAYLFGAIGGIVVMFHLWKKRRS
jgi:hypothetical protein